MDRLTADVPPGEPLDRLAGATELAGALHVRADELLDEFVTAARRSGASWSEVGAVLGTSKQAAHQRFSLSNAVAGGPTGPIADLLASAGAEASGLGHHYIRPEHVLLAMSAQEDELAGRALRSRGVTPELVRTRVEARLGRAEARPTGTLGVAPETKRLLALAGSVGKSLGHGCPRSEHVLLAAIDPKLRSPAGTLLADCGASPEHIHKVLALMLHSEAPELARRVAPPGTRARIRLRRSAR